MNTPQGIEPRRQTSASTCESGFMLVFVVLLTALLLISLAVAAPVVAKDLQRDKEVESAHRANQYVRAIRVYYLKNHAYPPSMEALENTNNVRYLRKQYIDPLTGKNDWRIIRVGENKTTVKGFFGQPLGGLNSTGAGASLGSTPATTATPSTTVGSGSPLAAGFQGATIGGGSTTSGSAASTSSSGSASVGQIMGVGTSKNGTSILNPNGQTTYNTWEFIYDPKIELLYAQANLLGGGATAGAASQPAGSLGSKTSTDPTNPNNSPSNTPAPATSNIPH